MQYRQQCRFCLATHPIMINQNLKSFPFYQNFQGKREELGHAVRVYGLIRVLVFLLVDETMQYRQQCRFMFNQNLRVYHFIEIFKENTRTLAILCVCTV